MRLLRACLLLVVAVVAHSQATSKPAETTQPRLSVADFGLVYPLSNDWIRATELIRKRFESSNSVQSFDILLAAVYLSKSSLSPNSPFFYLVAYRQPATDCRKNLEAMIAIANSEHSQNKPQSGVMEFSAAGRSYFRVNLAHDSMGRHQCMICTAANGHLLIWNAGAPNDKGLDAIVSTLDSIMPLAQKARTESVESDAYEGKAMVAGQKDGADKSILARPERVKVSVGLTTGLLINKVPPIYPEEARRAHIEGTVVMQAEIDKAGDITDLELLDGPIELAVSAVAAVRQWKYKPYLLLGQPVAVTTQIQVNYQLRR